MNLKPVIVYALYPGAIIIPILLRLGLDSHEWVVRSLVLYSFHLKRL